MFLLHHNMFAGSTEMIFFSILSCAIGSQGGPNKMAAVNFLWLHSLDNRSSIQPFFFFFFFWDQWVISGFGRHLSDARQGEFRLFQSALLWISKVRGYDYVCRMWSAKKKYTKHANTSYKATEHIERTFQNSDYSLAKIILLQLDRSAGSER